MSFANPKLLDSKHANRLIGAKFQAQELNVAVFCECIILVRSNLPLS